MNGIVDDFLDITPLQLIMSLLFLCLAVILMVSLLPSQLQALSLTTTTTETKDASLLWQQAGKSRKKQILLKQKERERIENMGEETAAALPDPLVSYKEVQDVKLVASTTTVARIHLQDGTIQDVDPRNLHQTSDFELWMQLRDQVDVSASQFSVVLGTNYFNSRDSYLAQKVDGTSTIDNNKNASNQTNSAACAWGIRMEPLAFAQYSQVMLPTHVVKETGMHILKHTTENGKEYLLGASPDGIVTERLVVDDDEGDDSGDSESTPTTPSSDGLLEIKSLWGRRHSKGLPKFDYCPKRYYDQIQGQLAICDKEWCDLMMFIPGTGTGGTQKTSSSRRGKRQQKKKAARMRKRQQEKQKQNNPHNTSNQRHGQNYSIVRVERNVQYWEETLLPALVAFCDEVEQRKNEKE